MVVWFGDGFDRRLSGIGTGLSLLLNGYAFTGRWHSPSFLQ